MTRRTTDYANITHAMELLRSGVLASALPEKLMSEYGLSPERAGELARQGDRDLHKAWQAGPSWIPSRLMSRANTPHTFPLRTF